MIIPIRQSPAVGDRDLIRPSERRRAPRADYETTVKFRNAIGQHCAARLINISQTGMQVRCNCANAQALHTTGGRICDHNTSLVQIELPLAFDDRPSVLSVGARLAYLSTAPQEPRCILGLEFLDLRPTAERTIRRLLEHLRIPYDETRTERRGVARFARIQSFAASAASIHPPTA